MEKNRLEAFSDGVIAIIITIMVLELKIPHGINLEALRELIPVFVSYVLSFLFVGIYWNNHHHTMQAVKQVNGAILWANMHLLFWLSLIPFVTGWMGENHFASIPAALYGVVLIMAAVAYYIWIRTLVAHHGPKSKIAIAMGKDFKGKISIVLYAVGIAISTYNQWITLGVYFFVAAMWLIPDRRIEKVLKD